MTDGVFFKMIGVAELKAALANLPVELRRGLLRRALRAGAKVVLDATVPATPRLARPVYRKGQLIRTPGTLQRSLKIRTSRDATRNGDVGVFINIKPAPPGQRGKYSPTDPFYWRWIHFRTKKNNHPVPFLNIGARKLETEAKDEIERYLAPRIADLNREKP